MHEGESRRGAAGRHLVFIVEDHPVMREAYAAVLEREPDLEVCGMAERAEEALDHLRAHPCDVAIVDVSLPDMSGLELVERLRAERAELRLLVISGHGADVFASRALDAGADRYVSKRTLAGALPDTIREVLAARRDGE